jgi:hypothetical protein
MGSQNATLRRTRNSSCITLANREPVRVVDTGAAYSGCAERWAALPNAPYKGITFSMPEVLWSVFCDNPPLAKALSALAAEVIQARTCAKYGLRVGVIAILHTFNGTLKFNAHVHTMVTGGGLRGASDVWVSRVYYDRDLLMKSWRKAVVALLRAALRAGQLRTELSVDQMYDLLTDKKQCID